MEKSITYLKTKARTRRRKAIRKKLSGTAERPRLAVFRSLRNIYAQVIDDVEGKTLAAMSTKSKEIKIDTKTKKVDQSFQVGLELGKKALAAGITKVSFDRAGFKFHGRVKALAAGARKAGLSF